MAKKIVAPAAPVVNARVDAIAPALKLARTINPANAITVVAAANAGYNPANRNVGRYTGMRVVEFQNACMVANATWQLDDCMMAALWAMEFPRAVGRVFAINGAMTPASAASVRDAIGIVRGVRSDYNRTGHGDATIPNGPKIPSVSYGTRRFDIHTNETNAPAVIAPAVTGKTKRTAKPAARKSAAA